MFYFDLLSAYDVLDAKVKYTGGTNYALGLLKDVIEAAERKKIPISVIVPKELAQQERKKIGLLNQKVDAIVEADKLLSVDFMVNSTLFIPQVHGKNLLAIRKLKKARPDITIHATLHDRQHNFYRFDWYDRFYYSGVRRIGLLDFVKYWMKAIAFNVTYGKCIESIDNVSTVSNYSMQKLMHRNVKYISYYIQKNSLQQGEHEGTRGDYILFIGGNRPEKNLLRTLEAFGKFKSKTQSLTKLVVTGVNDELMERLYRSGKLDTIVLKRDVVCYPYVSYEKLIELYRGCRYVVFPSKGEGYGLPVREAMACGKVVLASRTTSVPEVAGAVMHYVDPFCVDSIVAGLEYMDHDEHLDRLEMRIPERRDIVEALSKQDRTVFIEELLS